MNIKSILTSVSVRPAKDTKRVVKWLMQLSIDHWAQTTEKHRITAYKYPEGSDMRQKAMQAYCDSYKEYESLTILQNRMGSLV